MQTKNTLIRCKEALKEIWHLNRVHVSKEMSLAYRLLKKYFTNLKIFGYETGKKCDGCPMSGPPGSILLPEPIGILSGSSLRLK